MARFRTIEHEYIILRREEASACLHYLLYHSATLSACSGIELLLEFLVSKLYEELTSESKRRGNTLLRQVEAEEKRNNAKSMYWGLKSWVDFYKRNRIFEKLHEQFNYRFKTLNNHTLSSANEIWNKCKHDPYLATRDIAIETVNLLNDYLEETEFQRELSHTSRLTVSHMSAQWLDQWERPLVQWVAANGDAPQAAILMYLAPFLDLIIRLIDDSRVTYTYKTPLLVAVNYVFSSIDLMPEHGDMHEVHALVDDGAVIALSLYWLLHQTEFDSAILYSLWPAGQAISDEIDGLKQIIWNKQADLFPDSRGQIGHELVWKIIERIAVEGPEALWQNYWKEQYRSET